jgi:hypothetical protein
LETTRITSPYMVEKLEAVLLVVPVEALLALLAVLE